MIKLSNTVSIPLGELDFSAIRAMGSGGQNVNKVSSAIHLRFDIKASSLPDEYKRRIISIRDSRLTKDGVIVIKAQAYRTQEQNKAEAILRLESLLRDAIKVEKKRRATRPTLASKRRRLDGKKKSGQTKTLRRKVDF